MPQAAVVVDRWHVVRTAVESMRKARIAYQQTLEQEERKELQRCLWLFQKRWRRLSDQQKLDLDGWLKHHPSLRQIGSASCRERVGLYVWIQVLAVLFKKQNT